jgi:hypothetical protein
VLLLSLRFTSRTGHQDNQSRYTMGEIYEMTRDKGQWVEEGKRDATREELLKPNQGSQVNFD